MKAQQTLAGACMLAVSLLLLPTVLWRGHRAMHQRERSIMMDHSLPVQTPRSHLQAQLLVLVIASQQPISYRMNWAVWRELRIKHRDVQVYMVVADPTLDDTADVFIDEETHTIYVKTEENYIPGVLIKTVKALALLLADSRRTFTHVLRTNLSSMWHWGQLLSILDALSREGDFVAGSLNYNEPAIVPAFVSGTGILMTRHVADLLVEHAEELRYDVFDDLSIGILMEKKNVRRIPLRRCDITNNTLPAPLDVDPSCFFYRIKNNDGEGQNSRDYYDEYIFPRLFFELYFLRPYDMPSPEPWGSP